MWVQKMAKKERRNSTKNSKVLIYFLIFVCIILMGIFCYYYLTKPLEIRKIDVKYIVDRKVGFDLNSTAFTFGIVPPGGTAIRNLTIGNVREFPIRADIFVDKNISDLLIAKQNATVAPHESEVVSFALHIPENYTLGNYTSFVIVKIYKA
jgi:hypothetical protein